MKEEKKKDAKDGGKGLRKPTTRRQFLKVAGVGGLSAASLYPLGCAAEETTTTVTAPGTTSTVTAPGVTTTVTGPGVTTTVTATPPEITWDRETDVVVVGTGVAGYSAACAAAENGASVILLEKLPTIGGNSRMSGGNYGCFVTGVDALEQRRMAEDPFWHVGDSAELYYNEKLKMGDYRSDAAVTRVFAYESKAGYEWTTGLGYTHTNIGYYGAFTPILAPENHKGMHFHTTYNASFDEDGNWIGVFTKGRHHKSGSYIDARGMEFRSGEGCIFAMADEADRLGVELIVEMKVTEIIRDKPLTGDALGVRVTDLANNKELTFRAKKGVILAAGGCIGNLTMVSHYDPRHTLVRANTGATAKDKPTDGGKYGRGIMPDGMGTGSGSTGEVLVAAMDIGADVNILGEFQLRWDRSTVAYTGPWASVLTGSRGKYIDVDGTGNRIWDEYGKAQTYQGRLTYVYQNGIRTRMGEGTWWGITDSDVPSESAIAKSLDTGNGFQGDTLEELAGNIGVPPANLVATVSRYNELVDLGEDVDFGQLKAYLIHKIDTPPFYAFNKCYYRHTDMGGVRVNANFQVIDRRDQVIPRLYAAGEQEGSTHGIQRDGGCGWTQGVVGGRTAGKHAAALIT